MESIGINILIMLIFLAPLIVYLMRLKKKEASARAAAEEAKMFSGGPRAQHPHIDISQCIGCGACADACPEDNVLAVFAGKATIINSLRCVGHGLCEEACSVGAIIIVTAGPSINADMPRLTPEYETNISNMFIVGELGGLALIKNAVNQGRDCADIITRRLANLNGGRFIPGVYDVCIVGAGPGGISASLRAIENKLSYITLEQDEVGGTVAKYPRQKVVMTSPVHFPMYGSLRLLETTKEDLLALWGKVFLKANLKISKCDKVDDIRKKEDGIFNIHAARGQYRAHAVVLALGRRGTPQKLGIQGEELSKVMYSLIEAEAYTDKHILVIGGGDSAVEAAVGLAHQKGNKVTLSYRQAAFTRIKERNLQRIQDRMHAGKISVLFNSNPVEFKEKSAVLEVNGVLKEIENDYVWIFAGGTSPNAFLKKLGVQINTKDLTKEAAEEAAHTSPKS
jgi:thioredoxin reductase (NADPH)